MRLNQVAARLFKGDDTCYADHHERKSQIVQIKKIIQSVIIREISDQFLKENE
jgi:hypothetical protein